MSILPLIPLLISFLLGLNAQQSGIPQEYPKYFMMEIGPATAGDRFEFELVWLSRSGKEVVLQRIGGKAPFKLSLYDETFLILLGKKPTWSPSSARVAFDFSISVFQPFRF